MQFDHAPIGSGVLTDLSALVLKSVAEFARIQCTSELSYEFSYKYKPEAQASEALATFPSLARRDCIFQQIRTKWRCPDRKVLRNEFWTDLRDKKPTSKQRSIPTMHDSTGERRIMACRASATD